MPVLGALPAEPLIIALRGKLDYYLWRGIPCCRTWPRAPRGPRSPAVQVTYTAFGIFAHDLTSLGTPWVDAARVWTAGTRWVWRDLATYLAYGQPPVPP